MIIGLDLGKRTTGIAISNGQLAMPYATITHRSLNEAVQKIAGIIDQILDQARLAEARWKRGSPSATSSKRVENDKTDQSVNDKGEHKVVIGYVEGQIKPFFEKFAQKLSAKRKDLKVVLHDETLTTRQAMENMIKLGVAKTKRRQKEHQVAAAVILESYLDSF